MSDIIVIAIVVVPAILLLVSRSNAALTFLSLCVGSVLAQVTATDTTQVIGVAAKLPNDSVKTISLALLLLPPLMTGLFMMKSTKTKHILLQILPAFGFGAAALIISQPYLPPVIMKQLLSSQVWMKLDNLEVIVVGLSAFICLLVVWVQRPKRPKHDEEHHK